MNNKDHSGFDQEPKSTRLHRNVYVLALTSFLTDISTEMLVNTLPLFLVNVLGVRTGVVGLIDGIAESTASLVKVYAGGFSDRMQRRKPLAVLGYGLSALAKPFLFFASSWAWVLGVRFADRIGKGIRTAPRDALIAGSVHPSQRGLAFGLHRAGDTAGAFTGLLIAAAIIWSSQLQSAELTRQTFRWLVLASIIPAVLGVLVLAASAQDIEAVHTPQKSSARNIGWRSLDIQFKRFLFVMVLFTLGNSSDSFIILRGQERGLSVLQVMGMLLTFTAIYSLLSGPAGILSDRLGRRRLILAGWGVYGLCYLGFALSRTGGQIWLLFGLYGAYYAATEGVAKAYIADLVPQPQRGTAYGYFNAAVGISALPASLIAGFLWQGAGRWNGLGPAAPFFFGAGLAILAGLIFLWMDHK
jgi:MFS family permease